MTFLKTLLFLLDLFSVEFSVNTLVDCFCELIKDRISRFLSQFRYVLKVILNIFSVVYHSILPDVILNFHKDEVYHAVLLTTSIKIYLNEKFNLKVILIFTIMY